MIRCLWMIWQISQPMMKKIIDKDLGCARFSEKLIYASVFIRMECGCRLYLSAGSATQTRFCPFLDGFCASRCLVLS